MRRSLPWLCNLTCGTAIWFAATPLAAEDAYYRVPLKELQIVEGTLPQTPTNVDWRRRQQAWAMMPYAVLEGEGEVYPGESVGWSLNFGFPGQANASPLEQDPLENEPIANPRFIPRPTRHDVAALAVRAPAGREVRGWLFVPQTDWKGMARIQFKVAARESNELERHNFYLSKRAWYERLAWRQLPGNSWFRRQLIAAHKEATGDSPLTRADFGAPPSHEHDVERSFALLSGGRAVSENLQLYRLLPTAQTRDLAIELASLQGITVREMDWQRLTKGLEPATDPLAGLIPADQHAVFFPSFQALADTIDDARGYGTTVLHVLQTRAEDAQSLERYQRQLCLELDSLSRLIGPQVVESLAVTGSDPYLRTGTDLALVFQSPSPQPLVALVSAAQSAATAKTRACRIVKGKVRQVEYQGAVSADRSVSSYVALLNGAVVVTNSLLQLERIAACGEGALEPLAKSPEYRFFRHRYARGDADETALVVISDATIRRWCGPKWRIATSRRTCAAAILADHQARHLDALVAGQVEPGPLTSAYQVPDLGTVHLSSAGPVSSTYGSLEFLTPIAELDFERVSREEARLYERWRDGYEQNWSQYFDPIAIRLSLKPEQVAVDLSVMPLIKGSDYNWLVELSQGSEIAPGAGDRHAGTLAHAVVAVNSQSPLLRAAGSYLQSAVRGATGGPFGWLGKSAALYADADPFWEELEKASHQHDDQQLREFLEGNLHRLPVAFRAEVTDTLRLTLFLTGLRTMVEQTAPGLTIWEALNHNDQPYTRVSPAPNDRAGGFRNLALYYLATPRSLTFTLNEELLKRVIDREAMNKAAAAETAADKESTLGVAMRPWLGSSLAVQLDRRFVGLLGALAGDDYQRTMQARAWANLPILNEWRRRYPQHEPLALHARHWQTVLRCPGGGKYVWNEAYQTMESTVYGHPGEPKEGPSSPDALGDVQYLNFGLTFQDQGLRGRVIVDRAPRHSPRWPDSR